MNYMAQINAFYAWLETHPQNSNTISVWFALMATCNKAGWPDTFTEARSDVMKKAGCGRHAFYDSRVILSGAGLIDYKEQAGRAATIYRIIPFVENSVENPVATPQGTQNTFVAPTGTQFATPQGTQKPVCGPTRDTTESLCPPRGPFLNDRQTEIYSQSVKEEDKTDRLTDILRYCGIDLNDYGEFWRESLEDALRYLTSPAGCTIGGQRITQQDAYNRLSKADPECIERAVHRVSNNGKTIGNPVAYLAATIYNAISEVQAGLTIDVARNNF